MSWRREQTWSSRNRARLKPLSVSWRTNGPPAPPRRQENKQKPSYAQKTPFRRLRLAHAPPLNRQAAQAASFRSRQSLRQPRGSPLARQGGARYKASEAHRPPKQLNNRKKQWSSGTVSRTRSRTSVGQSLINTTSRSSAVTHLRCSAGRRAVTAVTRWPATYRCFLKASSMVLLALVSTTTCRASTGAGSRRTSSSTTSTL